jgi:hypothetical protein
VVAFVLLVAVVGLLIWYNRKNKKVKKNICQEVGDEDCSSVDTHQGSPQIELEMGEDKPASLQTIEDSAKPQIEVEVAETHDGKEDTVKEGNGNREPADKKGEMCPVKEGEEEGKGRAENKTEEEEQEEQGKPQVTPKTGGELTEKKDEERPETDENKEIAKEKGPFVEPQTERIDNSQVTDSDTAAQPQDDTNPETVVCFSSSGQCIPRNSSFNKNLASSAEKLPSVSAPKATIPKIQEHSDKVVTSDKGSEESSEIVARDQIRNKRTTQNLRESLATQEPISAAMSNPYQPSPQPDNDEDITQL